MSVQLSTVLVMIAFISFAALALHSPVARAFFKQPEFDIKSINKRLIEKVNNEDLEKNLQHLHVWAEEFRSRRLLVRIKNSERALWNGLEKLLRLYKKDPPGAVCTISTRDDIMKVDQTLGGVIYDKDIKELKRFERMLQRHAVSYSEECHKHYFGQYLSISESDDSSDSESIREFVRALVEFNWKKLSNIYKLKDLHKLMLVKPEQARNLIAYIKINPDLLKKTCNHLGWSLTIERDCLYVPEGPDFVNLCKIFNERYKKAFHENFAFFHQPATNITLRNFYEDAMVYDACESLKKLKVC